MGERNSDMLGLCFEVETRIRSEMSAQVRLDSESEEAHPPSGLSSWASLCEWGPRGGVWGQSLNVQGPHRELPSL